MGVIGGGAEGRVCVRVIDVGVIGGGVEGRGEEVRRRGCVMCVK